MAIPPPAPSDHVTDDQLAAMRQAAGLAVDGAWAGEMRAALECCDRGWLVIDHLARDGVSYRVTDLGADVLRREQDRTKAR